MPVPIMVREMSMDTVTVRTVTVLRWKYKKIKEYRTTII
jgi:hypothetical protein